MQYDYEQGKSVHEMLTHLGIETPLTPNHFQRMSVIAAKQLDIMQELGLKLDDSLRDTPRRVAKMYCEEIFTGLSYDKWPKCTTVENKAQYQEMVLCQCTVMSMCEHHFIPFQGLAYIAYIPKDKILGLSKFNRVTDFFSRRPQIQERLTLQIQAALSFILETEDVAVVIRAEHLCVKMRGVKDEQSWTTTSQLGGRFFSNQSLRAEFLSLAKG